MLALRVEERSLRRIAREIGMSPSGLQKVLEGNDPYSATRRKLERWYVRERSRYGGELSAESARIALAVLLQDLPPSARAAAAKRVASALDRSYEGGQRNG